MNRKNGYAVDIDGSMNSSDFNNFYTSGSNLAKINNVNYASLTDLQNTTGTDENSYSVDVEFVSISDLHLTSSPVPLLGKYNSSFVTDFDGDLRNEIPFIGADEPDYKELSVKINLEGPYNNGIMNSTIHSSLPLDQPFPNSIHSGNEEVAPGFFDARSYIVDWIIVELRSDIDTKVASRAGFLLNNGNIAELDSFYPLNFFVDPGDYYIVIYQRNHLPVMSAAPITLE
jgi:hypothetical protein